MPTWEHSGKDNEIWPHNQAKIVYLQSMKKYLVISTVIVASVVAACTDSDSVWKSLQSAEAVMEESPEQALEMLDSLDPTGLSTDKARAKYALLMSMALDKNYVDLTTDSIITPAVKYYRHHGSADDRLKTYYYWGRIAMNAVDYEEAISRFILAEKYADGASDKLALGRLYRAQTVIYKYCYDTKRILETADKTVVLSQLIGDTTKCVEALFEKVAAFLNSDDLKNAEMILGHVKEYWTSMGTFQKGQYYASQLILYERLEDLYQLNRILIQYETEVDDPACVWWLPVAKAYYLCGEYEKAIAAIKNYDIYGDGESAESYYWICGNIHEAMGDINQAMSNYRCYIEQTDQQLGYLVATDTRFIKERYENQIKARKRNSMLLILALCVLILILSTLLVISRVRRIRLEKEKYVSMYFASLAEINNLNNTLKNNTLDRTLRRLIVERLNVLNSYFISRISTKASFDTSSQLKAKVQDKGFFLESVRIHYFMQYPEFVGYFTQRGLKDKEVAFCCLYAMGLTGKEIASYFGHSAYKRNSNIREKLGLTKHDTNLDIFIRDKWEEYL